MSGFYEHIVLLQVSTINEIHKNVDGYKYDIALGFTWSPLLCIKTECV